MPLEIDGWSETAASNTTVAGINIAENCLAANVNDAIRAIMAAIKSYVNSMVGVFAALGANTDITSLKENVTLSSGGTITGATLGYRGVPTKQTGGTLTLALTDAGGRIRLTTGGLTIPANASIALPLDTVIVVINRSGSAQTISITSDTLYYAGIGTTGSRTIADYGIATLVKDTATTWLIGGPGVS